MTMLAWFYVHAWQFILPALLIAAWRWGGGPEKTAATMYTTAAVASILVLPGGARPFVNVAWAMLAVDFALAAGLIWLALTADRFWPMPSAAFQALSCLGHIEKILEPTSLSLGYQLLAQASTYPTLLLLGAGIWRHQRRSRQERPYRNCSTPQDCLPPIS
jgi:hypothetical protein